MDKWSVGRRVGDPVSRFMCGNRMGRVGRDAKSIMEAKFCVALRDADFLKSNQTDLLTIVCAAHVSLTQSVIHINHTNRLVSMYLYPRPHPPDSAATIAPLRERLPPPTARRVPSSRPEMRRAV